MFKGKNHTEETKNKIKLSRKGKGLANKNAAGHTPWNKNLKGIHLSSKSEFKKGQIAPMKGKKKTDIVWNKGISFTQIIGEKNPNWKGGITPVNHKIRTSLEYKLWRKAVFERDNYTCIWCVYNKGHNLNADHIKPFAHYPELRFAIDNGRTLCESCHKKTDTFGNKGRIKRCIASA